MKVIVVLCLIVVGSLVRVNGECANSCSGHGRCSNYKMSFSTASETVPYIAVPSAYQATYGYDTTTTKKDSCTCFTRDDEGQIVYAWQGADCSERTCPYGPSWDSGLHANDMHTIQTECANRGICDRQNGECKCFAGYTGKGCRRTTCPNTCSGHGTCKSLSDIAKARKDNTVWSTFTEYAYTLIQYDNAWDADRLMGCECDLGFRGPDCSLKECPSTTDPMGGPGSESGRECSGRGTCNFESGVCRCFRGFFGTKCENQRTNFQ